MTREVHVAEGARIHSIADTPDRGTLVPVDVPTSNVHFIDLTKDPPVISEPPLHIDSPCEVLGVGVSNDGRFGVTSHLWSASTCFRKCFFDIENRIALSQYQLNGYQAFEVGFTRDGRKVIVGDFFGWGVLDRTVTAK